MAEPNDRKDVLLTGATGFVGQSLYPVLEANGHNIRCASRNADRARSRWPRRWWVEMDVEDRASIEEALRGCRAAYYLIHQMGGADNFEEREAAAAINFLDAATAAGVERIVYLGGLHPHGEPSKHLRSRLVTGAILRSGDISTVELRASVIIGHGSESWKILRDISKRLPVMLCPKWLRNRTEPVAIDDVTYALASALELEIQGSKWFSIPGPDVLSFQQCIEHVANLMGRHPLMIPVPVLTPRVSSYWLRLITGANYHIARALAEGLKDDLLAESDEFWDLIDHRQRVSFDDAVCRALAAEKRGDDPGEDTGPDTGADRASRPR